MIRRFLVWSLTLLVITSAEGRERTPLEQARKIPEGSEVVVTLKDKQAFAGRLGELSENSLTLRPFVQGEDRLVLFQDVKKITQRKEASAAQRVSQDILLVILLPVLLLYCGIFNHECLG